jgi:hypothetical protein
MHSSNDYYINTHHNISECCAFCLTVSIEADTEHISRNKRLLRGHGDTSLGLIRIHVYV